MFSMVFSHVKSRETMEVIARMDQRVGLCREEEMRESGTASRVVDETLFDGGGGIIDVVFGNDTFEWRPINELEWDGANASVANLRLHKQTTRASHDLILTLFILFVSSFAFQKSISFLSGGIVWCIYFGGCLSSNTSHVPHCVLRHGCCVACVVVIVVFHPPRCALHAAWDPSRQFKFNYLSSVYLLSPRSPAKRSCENSPHPSLSTAAHTIRRSLH